MIIIDFYTNIGIKNAWTGEKVEKSTDGQVDRLTTG